MKRVKLEGTEFGDFDIVEYVGDKRYKLVCRLCGEVKYTLSGNIKMGMGKQCTLKRKVIIEGTYIGEWYVKEDLGNGICICVCSCGKVKEVRRGNLVSGSTSSCGHWHETYGDLTGKYFDEWYVDSKEGYLYKCICSCGKIGYHSSTDLAQGKTKSCGHGYNEFKSLTGMQFGEWTVGEYLGNQTYRCECNCGTIRDIRRGDLLTERTRSCGCKKFEFIKDTLLEKYGETSAARVSNPRTPEQVKAVSSKEELEKFINITYKSQMGFGEFKPTPTALSRALGLSLGETLVLVHKYGLDDMLRISSTVSQLETDVCDYIKSIYSGKIERTNRTILGGKELDIYIYIYIPEKNIAIEIDGTYWHSEVYKDKGYHIEKTLACHRKGIRLIHIFEYEWTNNMSSIKTYLNNILGEKSIIDVKDTEIREVEESEARNFLDTYHLRKYGKSELSIGCYGKGTNELLAVMSFGVPKSTEESDCELLRYAVKTGTRVMGGAESLFTYFTTNNRDRFTSIITYTDIAKFTGNMYTRLGFKAEWVSEPSMHG